LLILSVPASPSSWDQLLPLTCERKKVCLDWGVIEGLV
jgi:hypothetical protein